MVFGSYLKTYVFKTTVLPILLYFWSIVNFGPDQSFSQSRAAHSLCPAIFSVTRGTQPPPPSPMAAHC
jgi:hypothetical protein